MCIRDRTWWSSRSTTPLNMPGGRRWRTRRTRTCKVSSWWTRSVAWWTTCRCYLLAAAPEDLVRDVIGPPTPGTVLPGADLEEVVEQLTANRGSSLLVVDLQGRPLGRILADDVVDALVESRGSRRWPWQTPRVGS